MDDSVRNTTHADFGTDATPANAAQNTFQELVFDSRELENLCRYMLRADADLAASGNPVCTETLGATPADARGWERPGVFIGAYRLLELIGQGGFGSVWLAKQERPVQRNVALKILRAGMDTRDILVRFEAERQALAVMDHTGVAKVFDAGEAPNGRPYFVMEHIAGVPFTRFCDSAQLNIAGRIALFIETCNAVQHAHQKGIIHRDLKPSNILVTLQDGKPAARVIDFGIAKATLGRTKENLPNTDVGSRFGTPEYMAPEQSNTAGQDVDTRADVYSLGVILYELLTGSLPIDADKLRNAGLNGVARIISEETPPTPSRRIRDWVKQPANAAANKMLADVAAARASDVRTLRRALVGDLDWITMKALELDRARRYETASAFAADLIRYMSGEPVIAAPPSFSYRARKFAKRHRAAVLISTLLGATLLGTIGTLAMWLRATDSDLSQIKLRMQVKDTETQRDRERERAEAQRSAAEKAHTAAKQAARFLSDSFWSDQLIADSGGDSSLLRALLKNATDRINRGELQSAPEAKFEVSIYIGETYRRIGQYARALKVLHPLVADARREFGEASRNHGEALLARQRVFAEMDKPQEAYRDAVLARLIYEKLNLGDDPESSGSLSALAQSLSSLSRAAEALPLAQASLEMDQRIYAGDNDSIAQSFNVLGVCLEDLDRFDEARKKLSQALEMKRRLATGDDPHTAYYLNNLGHCLRQLGRFDESLGYYEEALAMRRRLYPGDHPLVVASITGITSCLLANGRASESLQLSRECVAMAERSFDGDHPQRVCAIQNLAICLSQLGLSQEALLRFNEALQMAQRLNLTDNDDVSRTLNGIGCYYTRLQQPAKALPFSRRALEMNLRLHKSDCPDTAMTMSNLGYCLESLGRIDEALRLFQDSLEMNHHLYSGDHPETARALNGIGLCQMDLHKPHDAAKSFDTAERMYQRMFKVDNLDAATCSNNYASCLVDLNRMPEALAKYKSALEVCQRLLKGDNAIVATGLNNVAGCLLQMGRPADALPLFEASLAMRERVLPRGARLTRTCALYVAKILIALKKYDAAESRLLADWADLSADATADDDIKATTARYMMRLYETRDHESPGKGYGSKAAGWRRRIAETQSASQPFGRAASTSSWH